MENAFFNRAIATASQLSSKQYRLIRLVSQLTIKLKDINFRLVSGERIKDIVALMGRMVRAYATGRYRQIPWSAFLSVVAAIVYFINPFDLVPDFIPITGLTDDFGILIWVYTQVRHEIVKFREWEESSPSEVH